MLNFYDHFERLPSASSVAFLNAVKAHGFSGTIWAKSLQIGLFLELLIPSRIGSETCFAPGVIRTHNLLIRSHHLLVALSDPL
jgi:hypothetical protein